MSRLFLAGAVALATVLAAGVAQAQILPELQMPDRYNQQDSPPRSQAIPRPQAAGWATQDDVAPPDASLVCIEAWCGGRSSRIALHAEAIKAGTLKNFASILRKLDDLRQEQARRLVADEPAVRTRTDASPFVTQAHGVLLQTSRREIEPAPGALRFIAEAVLIGPAMTLSVASSAASRKDADENLEVFLPCLTDWVRGGPSGWEIAKRRCNAE